MRVIRIIASASYTEHTRVTRPLFQKYGILDFRKLVKFRLGLFMYKIINGGVSSIILDSIHHNREIHHHDTRQSCLLHTPVARLDLMYRSASFQCVHLWNDISVKMNTNVDFTTFKCNFMKLLLLSYSVNTNLWLHRMLRLLRYLIMFWLIKIGPYWI